MVPAELLEASEIEELKRSQKAAQPEPSPEQLAAAEVAKKESEAKLISAQADLTAAQAKLAEAQQMAPERIKDLVAEALAAIMRDGLPSQPGSMSNGSSDQASA
jgi:multidrug resistance efflux pump